MKKAYLPLLTGLLALLFAGCQLIPAASPTPEGPTMPPAQTDGGLPPRVDDPIDIWRERPLFAETEVILPEKAANYPILITEHIELDWDALKGFFSASIPDGAWLNEEAQYFKDTKFAYKEAYGERHNYYELHTDAYQTDYGRESAKIHESIRGLSGMGQRGYHFQKLFEDLPLLDSQEAIDRAAQEELGAFPYTQQEAISLALGTLAEWGVPVDELEPLRVWEYGPLLFTPGEAYERFKRFGGNLESYLSPVEGAQKFMYPGSGISMRKESASYWSYVALPYGGRGITMLFRHMLYELPVYNGAYVHKRDPNFEMEYPEGGDEQAIERYITAWDRQTIYFWGDYVEAIVSDLGLRHVGMRFHRVVEVERFDMPIIPLSNVIENNLNAIMPMERVGSIELMLVPTYYNADFEETRYRLVPAWCFFSENRQSVIIDAMEGKTIDPLDDRWRLWPPGIE